MSTLKDFFGNAVRLIAAAIFYLLIGVFFLNFFGNMNIEYLQSSEKISNRIRDSLNKEMATDRNYQGLSIGEVVLVRTGIGTLSGYVEYKYKSEVEKVNLSVSLDFENMLYRCEPPNRLIQQKSGSFSGLKKLDSDQ